MSGFNVEDFIAPVGDAGGYFANAAVGRMSPPVLDTVVRFLNREAEVGGTVAAAEGAESLLGAYADAATLIGATVDEVAMPGSGNQGLVALIASARLRPGDRVLVDRTSWGGVLTMLRGLEVTIDVMPVDAHGRVDVAATRRCAEPDTKLIVLTWAPAVSGIVNPAVEVGALAADLGAWYIVDACQLLGQRPVDVRALRCHGLAASGRKWLRGPRGTGLLYASRAYLDATRPFMPDQFAAVRNDARRYENGEAFVAGRHGLGMAIRGLRALRPEEVARRLTERGARVREALAAIPHVIVRDTGPDLSVIVTFTVAKLSAKEVVDALAPAGIVVSDVTASYAPHDMTARGLGDVVRAAPQLFTTDADIDRLASAIAALTT